MVLFDWNNSYSVSVAQFDADHKKLFRLLNELNEAMNKRQGEFALKRTLNELLAYSTTHFAAEEAAMTWTAYPDLEAHRTEHEKFRQKVTEFTREFESGAKLLSVDVLFFMRDWLTDHIAKTDKKYSECLNKAGVR